MRKSTRDHPCMFSDAFVREHVDPRVKTAWEERFHVKPPFSRLRLSWREEHCMTLNPYESAACPYTREDCALAFLRTVRRTCESARDGSSAVGYFRRIARADAARRADEKPLVRRYEEVGPQTQAPEGRGESGAVDGGGGEGQGMRRSLARPVGVGAVLGAFDFGPREGRPDDGKESTE